MSDTMEVLMKDINDRLAALDGLRAMVSEERIKQIVESSLQGLMGDEAFVRKMRFGGGGDQRLVGSKFARWNLTVADIEFLYDLQESLLGQRKVNGGVYAGPSEELKKAFETVSEAMYIPQDEIRKIDQRAIDDLFPRIPLSVFRGGDRALAQRGAWEKTLLYAEAMRAMDTAEAGYGQQLVGAQYVGELWEGARRESRIFSLLDSVEMTAPTAYVPIEADLPEMLWVAESTASNSSNYTTSKTGSRNVTLAAKKFVIHQMWSGELEEDSILPFIPFLRRQSVLSIGHYSDSVALNGDTTNAGTGNINLDDADPADTKHYLALDGIRHAWIVDNTANGVNHAGAGVTYAALIGLRKLMIDRTYLFDWGHPTMEEDLVYVADPETGDKISLLPEVVTIDKFGANATVLTGQAGRIGRHPLITSIASSLTEADAKVSTTAGNNILGQVNAFNRRGLKVGWRRRVRVETERLPATDQTRIVYSLRMALGRFSPTGAAAGIEWAAGLYNIGL